MIALMTLLQSSGAQRLGWMLLHSVWEIALLAGIYGLVRHSLSSRSSSVRYLVASGTMLCMVVALPLAGNVQEP